MLSKATCAISGRPSRSLASSLRTCPICARTLGSCALAHSRIFGCKGRQPWRWTRKSVWLTYWLAATLPHLAAHTPPVLEPVRRLAPSPPNRKMDAWLCGSSSVWRPPPEVALNLYQRPDVLAGLSAAGSTPPRAGALASRPATRASLLELDTVATWKAPDEFEIDEPGFKRRRSTSPPPGPRISQAAASRNLRVRRRARRLADVDPTSGFSACEQLSVGPDCARRYQNANQKFEQYIIEHKLHVQTLRQLDVAMIHYFDFLPREGDDVSLPRDNPLLQVLAAGTRGGSVDLPTSSARPPGLHQDVAQQWARPAAGRGARARVLPPPGLGALPRHPQRLGGHLGVRLTRGRRRPSPSRRSMWSCHAATATHAGEWPSRLAPPKPLPRPTGWCLRRHHLRRGPGQRP